MNFHDWHPPEWLGVFGKAIAPTQDPRLRRGLRAFWANGVFANLSENFVGNFVSLYALAYGATNGQIALLSGVSNLAAVVGLWPGAQLAERVRKRKWLVVLSSVGGVQGAHLMLALLPFLLARPSWLVAAIIALVSAKAFFGNFATPAWTALSAELVPLTLRGRYFSARNFAMGLAALVAAPAAGLLIRIGGTPVGYQLAFLVATVFGLIAAAFYAIIPEPGPGQAPAEGAAEERLTLWCALNAHPNFLIYCGTAFVWNLSIQVAAPFFNVYLVRGLYGTSADVGWMILATSLAGLLSQRWFGKLVDRRGTKWTMVLCGLLIPGIPFGWFFATRPWHTYILSAWGGFWWGGYNLAAFNFLLAILPEGQRARFTALYQTVVFISTVIGPLIGGFLVEQIGYRFIFLCSAVGRFSATLLLLRLVREPAEARPISQVARAM
jgi:MFS family permease